ncbi:hypothetical protein BC828DRAFT_415928 [Blastocladiella britannica]|nr:hypothetical protein BC828DRAFT_415928 [Blastocladiella britannica]
MATVFDAPASASPEYLLWTFLVYCLVIVVVFLFFLFYFPRLLASFLSRIAAFYVWRSYAAHVDVESLSIAPLAGRISFRNLRYIAENQSITVLQGHVTFRYWLWRVRDESPFASLSSSDGAPDQSPGLDSTKRRVPTGAENDLLPCRILVRVKGLEWCMYNRTPAFDWVEEQLLRQEKRSGGSRDDHAAAHRARREAAGDTTESVHMASSQDRLHDPPAPGTTPDDAATSSFLRRILPIEIDAGRGSIVIGNRALPTVLVADWRRARGTFSMSRAPCPADSARTSLAIAFHRGTLQMRANADYNPTPHADIPLPHDGGNAADAASVHTAFYHPTAVDEAGGADQDTGSVIRTRRVPWVTRMADRVFWWRAKNRREHAVRSSSQSAMMMGDEENHLGGPVRSPDNEWIGLRRYVVSGPGGAATPSVIGSAITGEGDASGRDAASSLGRQYQHPHSLHRPVNAAAAGGTSEKASPESTPVPPLPPVPPLSGHTHTRGTRDPAAEYAQVHKIIEFASLGLTYYWDNVGLVPILREFEYATTPIDPIGNGSLPAPEWVIDLVVDSASISYGPWADRQRSVLQRYFFPSVFMDAESSPQLRPGRDYRVAPSLVVKVAFQGTTLWRVPVREPSKDHLHSPLATNGGGDGGTAPGGGARGAGARTSNAGAAAAAPTRPYGWLDVSFLGGSVHVDVPMIVQEVVGYTIATRLSLQGINIATSVNYAELLKASSLELNLSQPAPQQWNAARTWDIGVQVSSPTLFLLRDHITLLQDLTADWGAPDVPSLPEPNPLAAFVSYTYAVNLSLLDVNLYLCINDHQVIDLPNDIAQNNFLIVKSKKLNASIDIPLTEYLPYQTKIPFSVDLHDATGHFSFATSSTLGAFLTPAARDALQVNYVGITGSYTYRSVYPATSETPDLLDLHVKATTARATLSGLLMRYLIILIDNYVGLHPEYVTLTEYKANGHARPPPHPNAPPSSPQETWITAEVHDATVLLPETLYSVADGAVSRLETDCIKIVTQLNPVMQDLQVDVWPILWSREVTIRDPNGVNVSDTVRVDSLEIEGLMVHGHRLFGQPPLNPEYGVSWKVGIDNLTGLLATASIVGLGRFAMCLDAQMDDFDNRIVPPPSLVKGLMDIGLSIAQVNVKLLGDRGDILHVAVCQLFASYSDLAAPSSAIRLEMGSLRLVHATAPALQDAVELASVSAHGLSIDVGSRPAGCQVLLSERLEFLQHHDQLTKRCAGLFGESMVDDTMNECPWFAPAIFQWSSSFESTADDAAVAQETCLDTSVSDPLPLADSVPAATPLTPRTRARHMEPSASSPGARSFAATHASSSSSIRSFATAPEYETGRARATTLGSASQTAQSSRFPATPGTAAAAVAATGTASGTRMRFPGAPMSELGGVTIPYRHHLRPYMAAAIMAACEVAQGADAPADGVLAKRAAALRAQLKQSLDDNHVMVFLECLGAIDIELSPASLTLLPSFVPPTPSVEALLDALYLAHIKSFSPGPGPRPAVADLVPPPELVSLGLLVRSVTVTAIQSLPGNQLLKSTASLEFIEGALGPDLVQLHVDGLHANAYLLPLNPMASFSSASSVIDAVFSTHITHVRFDGSNEVMGSFGDIDVNVIKPELLLGALDAWVVPDMAVPNHFQATLALMRAMAPTQPLREPPFIAQPSSLWRLGVRRHQHPPTWRLLSLFRALYTSSPTAAEAMQAKLASMGLHTFTDTELPSLFAAWRVSSQQLAPSRMASMALSPPLTVAANPLAFCWHVDPPPAESAIVATVLSKLQLAVRFDISRVHVDVEDNSFVVGGIHLSSLGTGKVVVHINHVGGIVKPGILAIAKLLQVGDAQQQQQQPPDTANALIKWLKSAGPNASRHIVASLGRADVSVVSSKLSARVQMVNAVASSVASVLAAYPGLGVGSGSTGPGQREQSFSLGWSLQLLEAAIANNGNPLANVELSSCIGVSSTRHVAEVGHVSVDLPQNFIQLYAVFDEWQSYFTSTSPAVPTPAPAHPVAPTSSSGSPLFSLSHGIEVIAPSIYVSLGALPSLSVFWRLAGSVSFLSPQDWSLDISRNDIGFKSTSQAEPVYLTLPSVLALVQHGGTTVTIGVLKGTVSSEVFDPIESSLSLLAREINDVLELILYLSPKLRALVAQHNGGGPSSSSKAAAPTHAKAPSASASGRTLGLPFQHHQRNVSVVASQKSRTPAGIKGPLAAAAPTVPVPMTVRVICEGVSLTMATEHGNLQVRSDGVVGTMVGDSWSVDSTEFSVAFLSPTNAVLSQLQFSLAVQSEVAIRFVVSRLTMMVQPKAMLQLVDLVAYFTSEVAKRKKARAAEIDKLSTTTQKVMASLDMRATTPSVASGGARVSSPSTSSSPHGASSSSPAGATATGASLTDRPPLLTAQQKQLSKPIEIVLDSIRCQLLVNEEHSTEFSLRLGKLSTRDGDYIVHVSDAALAIDGSCLSFPDVSLRGNHEAWRGRIAPCQLTVQSHLLPSVIKIVDETANVMIAIQTLADSLVTPANPAVTTANTSADATVEDAPGMQIPLEIEFQGGRGILIDSLITLPALRAHVHSGLLWCHVSGSQNTLFPSVVELLRSLLLGSNSGSTSQSTAMVVPSSSSLSSLPLDPVAVPATVTATSVWDAVAKIPFRVLFTLEPTSVVLKGRQSKCTGQLDLALSVSVDPALATASILFSSLAAAINHPFASEPCASVALSNLTLSASRAAGIVGELPLLPVTLVLRHALEVVGWVKEWTDLMDASSSTDQSTTTSATDATTTKSTETNATGRAAVDLVHTLLNIKLVQITVNMGQALGVAVIECPNLFLFAESAMVHVAGSVTGSMQGRMEAKMELDDFHLTAQLLPGRAVIETGLERISGHMRYQTAVVLVFEFLALGMVLVVRGRNAAELDMRVGDVAVLVSARLVPALFNIRQRFFDVLGLHDEVQPVVSAAPSSSWQPPPAQQAAPLFGGHVALLVGLVSVHVFGESLLDAEHVSADLRRTVVHLAVSPSTTVIGGDPDPIRRVLKIHMDRVTLLKVVHADLAATEPASVEEWVVRARGHGGSSGQRQRHPHRASGGLAGAAEGPAALTIGSPPLTLVISSSSPATSSPASASTAASARTGLGTTAISPLSADVPPLAAAAAPTALPPAAAPPAATATGARSTRLIAKVPPTDLTMSTWTPISGAEPVTVRHLFVTTFDGMVDLALNVILYRNLQDLADLYESEIDRTLKTLQILRGAEPVPTAVAFVLDPVEPPVLAPRLKLMAEATPPLEWLVKKDLVPKLAHEYLTLPLDRVLREVAARLS